MKLSAVVVTKNEAQNISRCLTSLAQVADEIIVIDAYSQDATPQICESFANVRFVSCPWIGLTAMKNLGKHVAQYDHVLSIAADEILSPELQHNLLVAKKSANTEILIMMNYVGGTSLVIEPTSKDSDTNKNVSSLRQESSKEYYLSKKNRVHKKSIFDDMW